MASALRHFNRFFISLLVTLSVTGPILAQPSAAEATFIKKRPAAFGFVHQETTGITSYLVVNGQERAVQFSRRSDEAARNSLFALKWNILLANADGKRIVVIGRLYPEIKRTLGGTGGATSETYQEFELYDWYILTPFEELVENVNDRTKALTRRKRSALRRSDFKEFKGREKFDLRIVQLPQKELPRAGQ